MVNHISGKCCRQISIKQLSILTIIQENVFEESYLTVYSYDNRGYGNIGKAGEAKEHRELPIW